MRGTHYALMSYCYLRREACSVHKPLSLIPLHLILEGRGVREEFTLSPDGFGSTCCPRPETKLRTGKFAYCYYVCRGSNRYTVVRDVSCEYRHNIQTRDTYLICLFFDRCFLHVYLTPWPCLTWLSRAHRFSSSCPFCSPTYSH